MFFNPFKKSESPNKNQGPATNEYVVKNEPKEERKPKTMEDTLTAKLELDELKNKDLKHFQDYVPKKTKSGQLVLPNLKMKTVQLSVLKLLTI